MQAKPIGLIIFDLDGTLVDSREDIAGAVNFTLKQFGLKEKSLSEITSYIGSGLEELIRKSLGEKKDSLLNEAVSRFEQYYTLHSVDKSRLYPGVKEVLEHFKDKRKSVVTNKKYRFARLALETLGVYGYFEDVLGGDNSGCMKPSSCSLDQTIEKLKVPKEKTIIVGDMDVDILAGKRAGIATCAVTYGIGKKEDILKARPDYIIDNISELKKIII